MTQWPQTGSGRRSSPSLQHLGPRRKAETPPLGQRSDPSHLSAGSWTFVAQASRRVGRQSPSHWVDVPATAMACSPSPQLEGLCISEGHGHLRTGASFSKWFIPETSHMTATCPLDPAEVSGSELFPKIISFHLLS
jgi:hypothetical protein